MWVNQWVVGFSTPQAAAQFRAQALARHMWDTPSGKAAGQSTAQRQQQKEQQRQGPGQEQCQADGGVCQAAAAGGAAGGIQGNMPEIPRTVTVLWYPEDYTAVTNHRALVTMLEDLTEPYGFKVSDSHCDYVSNGTAATCRSWLF